MRSTPLPHPEKLLHAVLDSIGVALIVVDNEGRFVITNHAALQMFGSAGSMKNLSIEEWQRDYVFRDKQMRPIPTEQAPLVRALAGEELPPQDVDVTLPDGRRKFLHAAGHQFSVLGLKGVLVVVADETKAIELREGFERAVHAEALGLMAGGLIHDLNNMLSVISGNVFLLKTDDRITETGKAKLQEITVALQRGAGMAKRLVRFGHPQELQTQPVQINDVVKLALELVNPLLKGQVRVRTEFGQLRTVEGDPSRIEQVLVNLILNALDAMPEGGDLTLRTALVEPRKLTEVGSDEDEKTTPFVCITVADTGVGIPEDIKTRIFDPFFTTKPPGKGTGLGLASAHATLRQHKGYIKVESAPGSGAKFSIYLPVEEKIEALNAP